MDARILAFEILDRVERAGAYASILLDARESRLDDPRDAALVHEIVLGVLRRRAVLDHALDRVARRSVSTMDAHVRGALRIGAYCLLYLERIPEFAAVDRAVDLVRRAGGPRAVGFANAVLRALARAGRDALPPPPGHGDVAALALHHSHPAWWVERLVRRTGWESTDRLLARDNEPAPTVLRANLGRTSTTELAGRLAAEGVATEPGRFVPDALRVVSGRLRDCTALGEGQARVQDEAAQLVTALLGRDLGPAVLDLCAAPGGKTVDLAERLARPGLVVAVDRHPGRLRRVRENVERAAARDVVLLAADSGAARAPLRGPFRHLLVDAPCSGTGTLRRHPEIRWRLEPSALARLAGGQRELLETAARLSAPGSALVYSVCSLEPEEGEDVVAGFLATHREFRVADPRPALPPAARRLVDPRGFLRTSPLDEGLDGFFAALLLR